MPIPCYVPCGLCGDEEFCEMSKDLDLHCSCFKLSPFFQRDKVLPECNQCVNCNCTIGIQNFLALRELERVHDLDSQTVGGKHV